MESKGFDSENKFHRELDDPGITSVEPVVPADITEDLSERRRREIARLWTMINFLGPEAAQF
jgi:hypothetical protein